MKTLFKNLLKYQESQNKSNLENYLTEILCDYLNRLSSKSTEYFIKNVLFSRVSHQKYHEFIKSNNLDFATTKIEWKTQYTIYIEDTIKFPDLICFANNTPILIIEVKVSAGFTNRRHESHEGEIIDISQLVDYDKWIYEKNNNSALILLSHRTSPPNGFLDGKNIEYSTRFRNFITWQQVYNWLIIDKSRDNICITKDFYCFLKEVNVAMESPNISDFSILELFASGAGERIDNLMKFTRDELEKKYKNNFNWNKEKSCFHSNGLYTIDYSQKVIWSWVIIESKEYSYIGWGICYPQEDDNWGWNRYFPKLPKTPFVFIGLFSELKHTEEIYQSCIPLYPENWQLNIDLEKDDSPDLLGIKTKELHEFFSYEKDIIYEFHDFIDRGFEELQNIISKIAIR